MIWFRRLLAIPIIIIFIVLFIAVLVVTQINGTVGNPAFYNDQLRRADMYNFIYDEAMPAALDEMEEADPMGFPIRISLIRDDVISATKEALPPEWLQAQTEAIINAMIPYIVGDSDSFTNTIVITDRVEAAAEAIKDDILHGDASTSIYDDLISSLADGMVETLNNLPFSLSLTKTEVQDSLVTALPKDWIVQQVEGGIDSLTSYLTGDSDHFTIAIQVVDRVDPFATAVFNLLNKQETHDFLLDELITPTIEANLGIDTDLPFDVTLSQAEVTSAIKQALPQSWVEERLEDVINGIADYIAGRADDISVTVDLADKKAVALAALTDLADQKLEAVFYTLPEVSMAEFLLAIQGLPPGEIPNCRAAGQSYEDFKTAVGLDVASWVDQEIGAQIPNQWVYTDADLRQSLGQDLGDFLDGARDWVSEGWAYSDTDLADRIGSEDMQRLDEARTNGYTITETDLRDMIGDEEGLDTMDTVRHWSGVARTWLWALWLLPFLFLGFIGLLGGRSWMSKLCWALAVLFVVSLALYIAIGPVYASAGGPRIEEAMPSPTEYEGVGAVLAEKGNEVIDNVASSFVAGLEGKTLYTTIGSGVALLAVVAWIIFGPRIGPMLKLKREGLARKQKEPAKIADPWRYWLDQQYSRPAQDEDTESRHSPWDHWSA